MKTPFFPAFRARLCALGARVQRLRRHNLLDLDRLFKSRKIVTFPAPALAPIKEICLMLSRRSFIPLPFIPMPNFSMNLFIAKEAGLVKPTSGST